MKGVSPVVATVLLIAITVMAAVGVWYYTQNLTAGNTDSVGTMQSIKVTSCIAPAAANATMLVRNMNADAVSNAVFTLLYQANNTAPSGNPTFAVTLSAKQGAVNATVRSSAPLTASTSYIAVADGFSDVMFTCS